MSIPLKLLVNFLSGFLVLFSFFIAGYSSGYIIIALVVTISAAAGYALSYIPSENNKKIFWSYGLAYISVPLLFILSSSDSDGNILPMQIIWICSLVVVYIASLSGGFSASKKSVSCNNT